jgi:hypothetical protein
MFPLRIIGAGRSFQGLQYSAELSPDDRRVRLVCGHQSDRNFADGRYGVLGLLHLSRKAIRFRQYHARGVSQAWSQPVLSEVLFPIGPCNEFF